MPLKPQAGLVRWAFEQVSREQHHIDNVRRKIVKRRFGRSSINFYNTLKNPVYCGKIIFREFRDEPRQLVQGLHEAIVSENLFYDVKVVLDGRKRI
jgi:site-specific DNA recombinase